MASSNVFNNSFLHYEELTSTMLTDIHNTVQKSEKSERCESCESDTKNSDMDVSTIKKLMPKTPVYPQTQSCRVVLSKRLRIRILFL